MSDVYPNIESIATKISSGLTPLRSNPEFWEEGTIPWLKTEQLGEYQIFETNEKITEDALANTSIKINPVNSISVALYGQGKTRGNVSILKKPMTTNQACCNIEVDETIADYRYVYFWLKINYHQLRGLSSGVRPNLTSEDIKKFPFNYKELDEQKEVAEILSSIEEKISVNNKINKELESLARTLYNYWFVQFDFPISAAQARAMGQPQLEGKPYRASGGPMEYNAVLKREVPAEWEVWRIGDLLPTSLGGTPSTKIMEYWENGIYNWLNSGEIANFPIIDSELKISEEAIRDSATELLPKGSVLLSITRHLRPTILAIDACANQSVIGIREKGNIKSYFIYPYLQNEIQRLNSLRTGAQQPHINKEIVDDSLIVIPNQDSDIMIKYNLRVGKIYELIIMNAFENQELIRLRDFLLPLLMNGQVRVKSAGEEGLSMAAEPKEGYGESKKK